MSPADSPPPLVQPAPPPAQTALVPFRHAAGDPLEKFNRRMFAINQDIDRAVLRPAAMGYKHLVPRFLRAGLRHFFDNLGEPIVFANFALQLKPMSAVRTTVRFLVNSTIGLGGAIDVAKGKAFELPHRPNSFGDTLGFYGVKPGPYLFLPLFGPSDFRDFAGAQADGLLLPTVVAEPFTRLDYRITKAVITGLDLRAEVDGELHALLDDALDPYATLRSVYLQDRAGEIAELKGQSAKTDTSMPDDDLPDPAASGAKPPPAPATPELQDPLADPATAKPDAPPAADPKAPVQR